MPIVDIAAGWYTSGTVWAGAGAAAALFGAVATVWVTYSVGSLRRRLYYGMHVGAPLLAAPDGMQNKLELRYDGALLADPRVITIQLISRSRKDIPNDAYNDKQPLRLDVGVTIVEVLETTSIPETYPLPSINADGTTLAIGPSLIGKRHDIAITVLTDGATPSSSAAVAPLSTSRLLKDRLKTTPQPTDGSGWLSPSSPSLRWARSPACCSSTCSPIPRDPRTRWSPQHRSRATRALPPSGSRRMSTRWRRVLPSRVAGRPGDVVSAVYRARNVVTPGSDAQIFMFVGGNLASG